MYSIKIDGKTFDNIPASIDDVSIERFIRFRNFPHTNQLQMLQWALDSTAFVRHTPEVEQQVAKVFALIQPVVDEIYHFCQSGSKYDTPDAIDVLGVEVKLKNGLLNELPYWPYVVTKSIVLEEAKKKTFDPTDQIPRVLAHYLYSTVTKSPYDEARAEEFVEVTGDIPMIPAIQLSNFFLLKHLDSMPLKHKNLVLKSMKTLKKRG